MTHGHTADYMFFCGAVDGDHVCTLNHNDVIHRELDPHNHLCVCGHIWTSSFPAVTGDPISEPGDFEAKLEWADGTIEQYTEAISLLREHQEAHGTAEDHEDETREALNAAEVARIAQRWRRRRDDLLEHEFLGFVVEADAQPITNIKSMHDPLPGEIAPSVRIITDHSWSEAALVEIITQWNNAFWPHGPVPLSNVRIRSLAEHISSFQDRPITEESSATD